MDFTKLMQKFVKDESGETGKLVELAIGLAIVLIVLSYVFAPVGLVAFDNVNRTAASSITSGTTGGNIWDAIIPIMLAALILAIVMLVKKSSE